MSLRRRIVEIGRVIAAVAALSLALDAAADRIQFSTPAVEIAAPPKAADELPEHKSRTMEFNSPEMQPAIMPSPQQEPQYIRRERKDDPREDLHPLLRTPKIFSDPEEEKARRDAAESNPLTSRQQQAMRAQTTLADQMRPDPSRPDSTRTDLLPRSLTPLTGYNWNSDEKNDSKKDRGMWGQSTVQPNGTPEDERARNLLAMRDDRLDARMDLSRPTPLGDVFRNQEQKDKPTAAQLERRAQFEQLLNPNASAAAMIKTPSSLEPVANHAAEKRPGPMLPPKVETKLGGPLFDPTAAFNQQQDRLGGPLPVLEDINKRFSPRPAPAAARPPSDPDASQSILNRSSGPRDFPSRRF